MSLSLFPVISTMKGLLFSICMWTLKRNFSFTVIKLENLSCFIFYNYEPNIMNIKTRQWNTEEIHSVHVWLFTVCWAKSRAGSPCPHVVYFLGETHIKCMWLICQTVLQASLEILQFLATCQFYSLMISEFHTLRPSTHNSPCQRT